MASLQKVITTSNPAPFQKTNLVIATIRIVPIPIWMPIDNVTQVSTFLCSFAPPNMVRIHNQHNEAGMIVYKHRQNIN